MRWGTLQNIATKPTPIASLGPSRRPRALNFGGGNHMGQGLSQRSDAPKMFDAPPHAARPDRQ